MKDTASDETVRIFNQCRAACEDADLDDVKDAACNFLASVVVGHPEMRTLNDLDQFVDLCCRDIKSAARANWTRRKMHPATQ